MKLRNILFVVSDIEKSKNFYKKLFGLDVLSDLGEKVILTEGLVLQERKLWETFLGEEVRTGGNDAELYFEEDNLDRFLEKLEESEFEVEYLKKCTEPELGRRVLRIYDPDKHVIEIGEMNK